MRSFRFRLDPVIRLKKYEIERKETEIAEIDHEISRILQEIEDGRQQVFEMRRRLMDDVSDQDYLREERSLDLYQRYMKQVEEQKREDIKSWEEKKQIKRNELLQLYREDKILERYKEKKQIEWQQEAYQQENKQMDEIGIQNYLRNSKNRGGVLLYLIVPLVLLAAAAGGGVYTGMINKEMLSKVPYLRDWIVSVTDTPVIFSATPEDYTLTFDQIFGVAPSTTMAEGLQNIQKKIEEINARNEQLRIKENELNVRELLVNQNLQMINDQVALASQQIEVLQDMQKQLEERKQSELSQNEVTFSEALKKMDPKNASNFIANLWALPDDPNAALTATPVDPNAPVEKKLTQNQKKVLRFMHLLEQKQQTQFFDAMMKNTAIKAVAPEIISNFVEKTMDELLDVVPAPIPDTTLDDLINPATGGINSSTTTPIINSNPQLPPPQQRSAG